MPIPLGILAVAGAGAGGGSAFDLLQTVSVSSPTSSITFSNVNTYSQYKNLHIRFEAQFSSGNNTRWMLMRLNGDSGGNYSTHSYQGEANYTNTSTGYISGVSGIVTSEVTAQGYANQFSSGMIDILDFLSTDTKTTTRMYWGVQDDTSPFRRVALYSGFWNNTAAITSMTFLADNGTNFQVGTRMSLYGLK